MTARYVIGVDLGTTNSAVAYVDTRAGTQLRVFEVPQLVGAGLVGPRRQLPSFVYLPGEHDLASHEIKLPWRPEPPRAFVGELARAQGARVASRMIASAKSWLCHPGVDRQAAILPWGQAEGDDEGAVPAGRKLSPVAAQAQVLAHIREAWDWEHRDQPDASFADQEVAITVPASFDEAARELTLAAAQAAGYPPVVLLEEPQAAFYAWIAEHAIARRQLAAGDRVLVFDVGGGTTDFTVIAVDAAGDGFERTAVGDHLLLGGDNVDLTLAKIVEQRLVARTGKKLDALQWHGLVHACRLGKEALLGGDASTTTHPVVVAGRGSKLIGGTLRDELTRDEVERVLLDGFFPLVAADATPSRGRGGLHEFGLPYAADAAVTRHLASFLARHQVGPIRAVLFNGGAMTPAALRQRVLDQVERWQGAAPRELPTEAPELAVALGAAYFGLVRRGLATRIRGGTARAFYVGVEHDAGAGATRKAVCVAPKGLDEGAQVELEHEFVLVTNRPVSFKLYSSTSRRDALGAVVAVGDGRAEIVDAGGGADADTDLLELPPIVTVLRARGRGQVAVRLVAHISELGMLELACVERQAAADAVAPERWRLAFDLRGGSGGGDGEAAPTAPPHPRADDARALVAASFMAGGDSLAALVRELETLLEGRRDEWSTATARVLFDALMGCAAERKRSADHEQRWLGLAGFCLRPGVGAQLDAWRARQMWGVFNEGIVHGKSEPVRLAWWIVWRRIAGGLSKGQQEQVFDRIAPALIAGSGTGAGKQLKRLAEIKPSRQELAEMIRTLASLERAPVGAKLKAGDELVQRLGSPKGRQEPVHLWALARLGARAPLYGPINTVVPASKVAAWLGALLAWDWPEPDKLAFPLAQLGRRTGDRSRDLDDDTRARLTAYVRALPGGERAAVLIEQVVALEDREERVAFGDSLPSGLRLVAGADGDDA
ncbi:MAG: hsp70 family protein [Kofleriaceae bacterium]|nr:hsp70 family protein [Kofleriaceae bacterium]